MGDILKAWSRLSDNLNPRTLKGLLSFLEESRGGLDYLKCEVIRGSADSLVDELDKATQNSELTRRHLPETSPLQELYEATLQAYDQLAEVVHTLREIESSWTSEDLEEAIDVLQEGCHGLQHSQENWSRWLESPLPKCAKCGYQDSEVLHCPDCQTDLLSSDSRSEESIFQSRAVLGPEYHQAFLCYSDLQTGATNLETFLTRLSPLRKMTQRWGQLVRAGALEKLSDQLADDLSTIVDRSLWGLHSIELATHTRSWVDINDGWKAIFQSGVEMQRLLPELHRANGDERQALALEGAYRTRDT